MSRSRQRFFCCVATVVGLSVPAALAQTADFTISGTPSSQQVCSPDDAVFTVDLVSLFGFSDPVTLSSMGEPAGVTAGFSSNPLVPSGSTTLTISNTGAAAPGDYMISIVGTAPTSTHSTTVGLSLFAGVPGTVMLASPADGSTNVPLLPSLIWAAATQAASYDVVLDDDPAFMSPALTQNVTLLGVSVGSPLDPNTTYYWRVQPSNACGLQSFSSPFSFTTGSMGGAPPSIADFSILATPDPQEVCMPDNAVFTVGVGSLLGYSDPVTLTSTGAPAGTTVGFSSNPVNPPGASTMTVSNTGAAAPGAYLISVVGTAPTSTHSSDVNLTLVGVVPAATSLTSPSNGAANVPLSPSLAWNAIAGASAYNVELDDDAGFGSPLIVQTTGSSNLDVMNVLQVHTTYYWRVSTGNACGTQVFSAPFSFTTGGSPTGEPVPVPALSTTGTAILLLILLSSGLLMLRGSGRRTP